MTDRRFPPLRLFAVFEAVLRLGNVQKAAAHLNVTQPAISQALKALEDHLGVRLLDRRTRPAGLTQAGRLLRAAVTDGLGQIAHAIDQIEALQRTEESSVTIACTICTGTYWLMPRLAHFYDQHPDIAVNVVTTQGTPNFSAAIDLVIRYGSGEWQDEKATKLFDEKVVPVCSPAVAKRFRGARGLEHATLLHVTSNEDEWVTWKDYFNSNGLSENRRPRRNFTNYVQATQAALAGQGVMLGWESNTGDLVREGRLVTLGNRPLFPKKAFYLVMPHQPGGKPAIRLLANWLGKR
jgi:LysR family transcriptional regulator, glycine cleavage system transcriptional activator